MKTIPVIFIVLASLHSYAQQPDLISKYIEQYKDLAIAEMKRTGVPASITLAQGIHETLAGTSQLVLQSNNHFGIKCKSNWTGESVYHTDDAKGECFRKYPSAEDSYRDHSDFLKNSQRYAFLFEFDPSDYTSWAYGLKKAGYATNPQYPEALIKLIEDYHLQDYTWMALGRMTGDDTAKLTTTEPGKLNNDPVETEKTSVKTNYPDGEFRINETKVVYARKGTSFLGLAKQYEVDLSRLFEFNEIPEAEMLDKDQLIYLQRKRKTGANDFHQVQPGESLHDIAQEEGIRLESLRELNWLKEGEMPAIGEQLNLKKKSSSLPVRTLKNNYSILPVNKTTNGN